MKEKPIFFSEEMVLAVLSGRKTQMRRPVNFKFRDGQGDTCTLQVGNDCTGHPRSGFALESIATKRWGVGYVFDELLTIANKIRHGMGH
ncbi:TPA: hypothetical protein ACOEHI_003859 [Enterobacter kobei]